MTQKRIHDYRGPRSSEDLNRKLVGIIPAGVYEGFAVQTDGSIDPGILFTIDGVRIEEDEAISVSVPSGDPVHPRKDLIVCQHQYEQAIPVLEAQYTIIQGVPAADPDYPDLPEHTILLARATMPQGGLEYSEVIQVGPPVGSVPELAGDGRTDQTVKQNADAIADLSGAGRTTETVKANSDAISGHVGEENGAHNASSIALVDLEERYTAENVEVALTEIAGEGRNTQTVKANADAISNLSSGKEDKVASSDLQICRNIPAAAAIPSGLGDSADWFFTADSAGHNYWQSKNVADPVLVVPVVTGRAGNSSTVGDWFDRFFVLLSAESVISRDVKVRLWRQSISAGDVEQVGSDLNCMIMDSSPTFYFKDLSTYSQSERCIHQQFDYYFTVHMSSTDKDKVRFHSLALYMVTRRAKL